MFVKSRTIICELLTKYGVSENFLIVLQALLDKHKVYVRLTKGLLQSIKTSICLKQGCKIFPLLFNLFIEKVTIIFDQKKATQLPLGGEDLSCLLRRFVVTKYIPKRVTKCNKQNSWFLGAKAGCFFPWVRRDIVPRKY